MTAKLQEYKVVHQKQAELSEKVKTSALPKGQKNYLLGQIGDPTATNLPTARQREKFVNLEQLEKTIDERVTKAAKKTAKAAASPFKGGNTNEPVQKNGLGDEFAKAANGNVKMLPPEQPSPSLSQADRRHLVGRIGHSYARLGFYCPDLDINANSAVGALSDRELVLEGARVDQLIEVNDIPFPSERGVTDVVLILVCPGIADKLPAEFGELRPQADETVNAYANNIRHHLRRWRAEEVSNLLQRLRQIEKDLDAKKEKKEMSNATTGPSVNAPVAGAPLVTAPAPAAVQRIAIPGTGNSGPAAPAPATVSPPAADTSANVTVGMLNQHLADFGTHLLEEMRKNGRPAVVETPVPAARPSLLARLPEWAIIVGIGAVLVTLVGGSIFSVSYFGETGKKQPTVAKEQPVKKPVVSAQVEQPPAKEPVVEQPAQQQVQQAPVSKVDTARQDLKALLQKYQQQ